MTKQLFKTIPKLTRDQKKSVLATHQKLGSIESCGLIHNTFLGTKANPDSIYGFITDDFPDWDDFFPLSSSINDKYWIENTFYCRFHIMFPIIPWNLFKYSAINNSNIVFSLKQKIYDTGVKCTCSCCLGTRLDNDLLCSTSDPNNYYGTVTDVDYTCLVLDGFNFEEYRELTEQELKHQENLDNKKIQKILDNKDEDFKYMIIEEIENFFNSTNTV